MAENRTFFDFDNTWSLLAGPAYGLPQPPMIGTLRVRKSEVNRFSDLNDLMLCCLPGTELPISVGASDCMHGVRLFAFWIGAVQRFCRIPISDRFFVKELASDGDAFVFRIALPCLTPAATKMTIQFFHTSFGAASGGASTPDSFRKAAESFFALLGKHAEPGLNRYHFYSAALDNGVPISKLAAQVYVMGTGKHTRFLDSSLTDKTSAVGAALANNKYYSSMALKSAGFPVPQQLYIASADDAVKAAHRLSFPVVIKPADQEKGIGVSAFLMDETSVLEAYDLARKSSKWVVIEKHVDGFTHRLTVVEFEVIRISKRIAGGVVGDGVHSVEELLTISHETSSPRKGVKTLDIKPVTLDREALILLAQVGKDPGFVPRAGEYVRLRRRDNINAGGRNENVDLVNAHPDNIALAIDLARFLRLDFAGVDLISKDISRSWLENGAAICEINSKPQFGIGQSPDTYTRVVRNMIGGNGRIPLHLHIVPDDDFKDAAETSMRLCVSEAVGVSSKHGIWVGRRKSANSFTDAFLAGRALLRRPEIEVAHVFMSVDCILRSGLPSDYVTDVWIDGNVLGNPLEHPALESVRDALAGHINPEFQVC